MRRVTASLMLMMFSFPLFATALLANAFSGLPACCRRSGRHHCEMAGMESSSQGPEILAGRCSSWPGSAVRGLNAQAPWAAAPPPASQRVYSSSISFSSQQVGSEQVYDTARKRGPPVRFE